MGWMVYGRNPRRARFSAAIQTSPKAHPAFQTLGTGALAHGMALTNHPLLVLRLRKNRGIPILPLCAIMACCGENFYYTLMSVFVSWNSAGSLVTACEMNDRGSVHGLGRDFSLCTFSRLAVGLLTQSLTQEVLGVN
jgi:hypothetical protein